MNVRLHQDLREAEAQTHTQTRTDTHREGVLNLFILVFWMEAEVLSKEQFCSHIRLCLQINKWVWVCSLEF
jgi:hypothetical protein